MHDNFEFTSMLILAIILILVSIVFTKLIVDSDLPMWLKFILLK